MIVCQHRRRQNAKIAFDPNPICLRQRWCAFSIFRCSLSMRFSCLLPNKLLMLSSSSLACSPHNCFQPSSTWKIYSMHFAKAQNPECKMLHSNLITLDLFMHLLLLNCTNKGTNSIVDDSSSCKIAFEQRIAIDRFPLLEVSYKNMLVYFCLCHGLPIVPFDVRCTRFIALLSRSFCFFNFLGTAIQ